MAMAKGRVFAFLLLSLGPCTVTSSESISMDSGIWSDCGKYYSYSRSGTIYSVDTYSVEDETWSCEVTISVGVLQKINLRFDSFNVYSEKGCSDHSLKIYDGSSVSSNLLTPANGLCANNSVGLPASIETTGSSITLYLSRVSYSRRTAVFSIVFTAVETYDGDSSCYMCLDNSSMCIDSAAKCDYINNCADESDESISTSGGCADLADIIVDVLKLGLIIIIVIVVAILVTCVGIIICIVCCCCRKTNRGPSTTTGTVLVTQPAQAAYPPQAGAYPPQQGGYPPQQGAYPPQQGGYPPQQGGYPPQQGGYPPQQPPPAGYVPPAQSVAYYPQAGQVDVEPAKV